MRLTTSMRSGIVSSVMADMTQVDYIQQACDVVKKEIIAKTPKLIRDAYKFDPACFKHESIYRDGVHISYPSLFEGARDIAKTKSALPLIEKHLAQELARREAWKGVEAFLSGCTTTEMVVSVAPELEKYLPKDAPKKHLSVATGLKEKLVAAGWPKGARK